MTIRIFVSSIFIILFSISIYSQSKFTKITADDNTKYTNTGNIGITVSNYGVIGDAFVNQSPVDQPSCEYPRGSGIEHLFDAGLWVGAVTGLGVERVTTGAFNASRVQSTGSLNFEFTNTANPTDLIVERSTIETDKFFDPEAISHQDFVANFVDTNKFVPGTSTQIPLHEPLGIAVHLETYAWNFSFADAFVIFNYTIKNVWDDTLKNVYVGLWADLVVRNTNILPPRVGAPFYQDVGIGYIDDDTSKMVYAFEYDGSNYTGADSYVSMTFLGADPQHRDTLYKGEVTHNWWLFSGGTDTWELAPTTEDAKYQRMSQSISDLVYDDIRQNRLPNNYMNLIATGPFKYIEPDSSINVVFAFVCGAKFGNRPPRQDDEQARILLMENVSWAQRAYYGEDTNRNGILDYVGTDSTEDVIPNGKLDRYILPTPPNPPKVKTIVDNQKVTLMWDKSSEASIDLISKVKDFEGYRVYRSSIGGDLKERGIFQDLKVYREYDIVNQVFYDTGLESIRMPEPITEIVTDQETGLLDTVEYHYRLEIDNLHNGWQYAFAVTAFDSDPSLNLLSLESSRLQTAIVVSPGTSAPAPGEKRTVGVYPNPYRTNALWDGGTERERKLFFYNLPSRSEIRIYTLAGDLVDQFSHEGQSYQGDDIQWYETYSDPEKKTIFPGSEHAWDLVTRSDQAIATGLYLYTVKDLESGEVQKGKFVVIK